MNNETTQAKPPPVDYPTKPELDLVIHDVQAAVTGTAALYATAILPKRFGKAYDRLRLAAAQVVAECEYEMRRQDYNAAKAQLAATKPTRKQPATA